MLVDASLLGFDLVTPNHLAGLALLMAVETGAMIYGAHTIGALRRQASGVRPAGRHQVLRDGKVVFKRVVLGEQLAAGTPDPHVLKSGAVDVAGPVDRHAIGAFVGAVNPRPTTAVKDIASLPKGYDTISREA